VLAVTALAGAARSRKKVQRHGQRIGKEAGDVLRLALAGIDAGAARLVDGDGGDLQGRRTTHSSAITSSTAHVTGHHSQSA